MQSRLIGIYGASGFGREVLPLVRDLVTSEDRIVFIDDSPKSEKLNNHDVITFENFIELEYFEKLITIAIADSQIRKLLVEKILQYNIKFMDIKSSNTIVMDDVCIGEGSILTSHVTLTSNIKIGSHFHANLYSYVAHDCVIGDFVTFAPSVKCNGNVFIENHAYIGTGAIIKQGTPNRPIIIGEGAVVGMGAVVTKSVMAGDVVFGNPAKSLKRRK